MNEIKQPLVLFDGVCNYCNVMVNFAIKNDKHGKLRFCMLQSAIARQLKLKYAIDETVDSLIFIDMGHAYTYADAALRICKYLDWPARILFIFIIIPSFISNPFYKLIARNRYKWFGKKESCMIPSPDIRKRFIE